MNVTPVSYTSAWFNGLLSGYRWADSLLSYSIPDGGSRFASNYSAIMEWNSWYSLSPEHQDAFRAIIAEVNSFTNLNLTEVDDGTTYGDIRIAFTDYTSADSSGHAYQPYPRYLDGSLASAAAGDIWLAGDLWFDSADPGTWLNHIMRHELGHALGLSHPFEAEDRFPLAPEAQDNYRYTVMSYSDHPDLPYVVSSSFQPMDIAALQYLYGANTEYNRTDTYYRFTDEIALQTLWDAGGYDTLDFSALSSPVIADLNEGGFSSAGQVTNIFGSRLPGVDNLAIAWGTYLEQLIATDYNDSITGASHDNRVELGAGDDHYAWQGGDDTLLGGSGQDSLTLPGRLSDWALDIDQGLQLDALTLEHLGTSSGSITFGDIEQITFDDQTITPNQLIFSLPGSARLTQQEAIWNSPIITDEGSISATEAQLYRTYLGIMGRTPDQAGFDWWLDQLQQGRSLLDMTTGFYTSPEFTARADTDQNRTISPEELLNELYINTLGRQPDGDGYNWWLNELYSEDRSAPEVMLEFTQSDEFVYASLQITGLQLWLS